MNENVDDNKSMRQWQQIQILKKTTYTLFLFIKDRCWQRNEFKKLKSLLTVTIILKVKVMMVSEKS